VRTFSTDEYRFTRKQRVARIATLDPKGFPHVAPVCYASDESDIYVASDYGSRKTTNLRINKKVSITIDEYDEDWTNLKGVHILGVAEIVESGPRFKKAKNLLEAKYPQYASLPIKEGETAIIRISPRKVVSWGLTKRKE